MPNRKRDAKAVRKDEQRISKMYEKTNTLGKKIAKMRALRSEERIRRTLKSEDQIQVLCEIYNSNNGKMPSKAVINQLGTKLGLTATQIYKWFWNKGNERVRYAKLVSQLSIKQTNPKGYIVPKSNKICTRVDGRDGTGKKLTLSQVKKAL